jgi:hypothetical protein
MHQHEKRLERHGSESVGGHAVDPTWRKFHGDDGDARRELAEGLTKGKSAEGGCGHV